MARDDGGARIAALIKKYRPGTAGASFRNAFRDAVSRAKTSSVIGDEEADLLIKARNYVEGWAASSPPKPSEAWRQWTELYETGKNRLPESVLGALLTRLPRPAGRAGDWPSLVFGDADRKLLRLALTRSLIRKADLVRMAKSRPAEFYRSVALDLLLEQRATAPRAVWEPLTKGEARPAGLLSGGEALVTSFDLDATRNAESWLLEFLVLAPLQVRKAVLLSMLTRAAPAYRLASYLCPPSAAQSKTGSKRSRKGAADERGGVVIDWVHVCEEALARGGGIAATATVVLSIIQLGLTANPEMLTKETRSVLSDAIHRIMQRALVVALRDAETEGAGTARSFALFVRGHELYGAVQEYLRLLPVGAKGDLESPERILRFERYQGRREVVQPLLSTLDDLPDEGPLRDAVEAVLVNTGVQPIGVPGERVFFDTHTHQAEVAGLLPGDAGVITRPGRRLGDEPDGIVLIKARVRPLEA